MSNNIPIPFHDIVNDIFYIDRKTYELCKSLQIEIDGFPKIIQNKNCYTITREQLKELSNKLGYPINSIKIILRDDKERIKKNQVLRILFFDRIMFIREDIYKEYVDGFHKRKVRVDGVIYIQVYDEDLVNIKRACRAKGIILNIEKLEIAPAKKEVKEENPYGLKDKDENTSIITKK